MRVAKYQYFIYEGVRYLTLTPFQTSLIPPHSLRLVMLSLDASHKLNKELQEEVELLLSGVQELSQKNQELQAKVVDGEEQEEQLQEEVEELTLQLQVMEASKIDVGEQHRCFRL